MVSRFRFIPWFGAFSVLGLSQAHATNGYFVDGIGTQSKGEAGVAYALPTEALSIATNPASASFVGNSVEFDTDFFAPQRSASITGNAYGPDQGFGGNKIKLFIVPEAGVVYQLPHNLSFGLAIYSYGGMDTNYLSNPYARFGATGNATIDLEQIYFSPTLSWKFAHNQSIGVSLNVVDEFFRDGGIGLFSGFSQNPQNFNHGGEDSTAGVGVRVGYYGQLTPWLAIGAAWQSVTYTGGFSAYKGLFAGKGGFDVPSTYGAGLAVTPFPALTAAFDVQRIDYREVHSVGDSFQVLFSGVPFGAANGPGFGWKNTTTFKFGVNYRVTPSIQLRAGYSYTTQPVGENQTFLNILAPGVVQNQFTVGATYTSHGEMLPAGLQLSAYGMYALPQTVNGQSSIPSAFGGGNANIKLSEKILGLGAGYTF